MREVGINKSRMGINLTLILNFVAIAIICAIMWGLYQANYTNEYWLKNGIEVEAEYVECGRGYEDNQGVFYYYCRYRYVSPDGKEYYASEKFVHKEDAIAHIGTTIKIVIDPNSNDVRHVDLKNLTLTYERDFILAIIFCFPVPVAAYLLIYRGIYRSVLNYKIRKRAGQNEPDFMGGKQYHQDAIKVGEVTKTRSWIVSYVKVKYENEKGITKEKWARAWFTRKEAKFLKEKKFINIVPYKNTYGILEQMP